MTELSKNFLEDRKNALEDAFFKGRDQALQDALRNKAASGSKRAALAAASNITDDAVLDHLVELGVEADTLAALRLLPLIAVAWADGKIEPAERDAILKAARQHGVHPEDPSHHLLDGWLAARPGRELIDAWKEYVRSIVPDMTADARSALRRDALDGAHDVAAAAGGFLGIAAISPVEKAALDDLATAFG